jgi:O-antigen/teichoic acid export membrane protein
MSLWRTILLAINLVGARFGGAAIALVSQILLARLLTRDEVGVVFMGMSAAAFLSLVVTAGYPQLAITNLPRYYTLGRTRLVKTFHAAFLADGLWMALATFAVAAGVYLWLPLSDGFKTAILFGCLSAPASALIRMNSAVANSKRLYALSYVPDFLYRPGLLLLFLIAAWLWRLPLSINLVLTVFVTANTLVAVLQALQLGRDGTFQGIGTRAAHKLRNGLRGRAMALVLVGAVAAAFSDIVTVIAGLFLPERDVAIVGVTIRLAALAGFITQATQQFILPDLTDAMTRGTANDVRRMLLRINTVALSAIIACIAGALVFGGLVLGLYGPDYVTGYWPLAIFMVAQAFRAASGMNQHLLSLSGYQVSTAGACFVAISTLVALTTLFTPRWGVLGLAMAVVIADALWATLLALQAQRLTGRRGDIFGVLAARA